ncbi:MAG: YfaZ family outer membrane protein [Thermodesulfobacteriota bacterium]
MIKKVMTACVVIVLLAATAVCVQAQTVSVDLGVSSDNIRANAQMETEFGASTLYVGAGGLYMEDDFTLYHLKAGLKQSVFSPALTLGLGFKGVAGEAEVGPWDFDVAAVGFNLMGAFDFAQTTANVPVTLFADATLAPDPLSFEDCSQYLEYTAGVEFYIIENGAIVAEYTKIEADLDHSWGFGEFEKSADTLYLGFRLKLGL